MRVAASLEATASTRRAISSPRRLNSRRNCATSAAVRSSLVFSKARRASNEILQATAVTDTKTVSAKTARSLRRRIMVSLRQAKRRADASFHRELSSNSSRHSTRRKRSASATEESHVAIAAACFPRCKDHRRKGKRISVTKTPALKPLHRGRSERQEKSAGFGQSAGLRC